MINKSLDTFTCASLAYMRRSEREYSKKRTHGSEHYTTLHYTTARVPAHEQQKLLQLSESISSVPQREGTHERIHTQTLVAYLDMKYANYSSTEFSNEISNEITFSVEYRCLINIMIHVSSVSSTIMVTTIWLRFIFYSKSLYAWHLYVTSEITTYQKITFDRHVQIVNWYK